MPPEQGLFLDHTWRLHPDLCRYTSEAFYEGRLDPQAGNERQALVGVAPLTGTGTRYIPIEHTRNQNDSPEEADRIAGLVSALVEGDASWPTRDGERRSVTVDDILIVAAYNAQVGQIKRRLPGARVGTVDKFQGQEAPVSIYSMASSTSADAPRGMEFLYSLNRLNVTTSRARCLTVLVASPELVRVRCRTPRQMQHAVVDGLLRHEEPVEVVRHGPILLPGRTGSEPIAAAVHPRPGPLRTQGGPGR
jgi:uncharacterized protein